MINYIHLALNLFIIFLSFIPGYYLGAFQIRTLNYYSILFWFSCVFAVIGSFIISSGIVDNTFFVLPIATNIQAKEIGLYITTLSFTLFFWSIFIIEIIFNGFKIKFLDWSKYQKKPCINTRKSSLLYLMLLSVGCSIYYINSIHPSPLFLSISGEDPLTIAIRRLEVTRDYNGIGIIKTLALTIPIITSYTFFSIVFSSKRNFKKLFLCLSFSLFVVTLLLLNGEKATVIFYMLGLVVIYSFIKNISIMKLTLFFILSILLIVISYVFFFQFESLNYLTYILLERIFIAQEVSAFYSADYFINNDFIGLGSMNNSLTRNLLQIEPSPKISEIFMHYYLPVMINNGGWNVNGYFAHESYAIGGWLTLISGAIIGGSINALLCIYFRRKEKNILNISFYAFYSISFTTILTSFNYMLFNTQLILIFIIYLSINFLAKLKI